VKKWQTIEWSVWIVGGILFAILVLWPDPDELSVEKMLFYGFIILWPFYCLVVILEYVFRNFAAGRAFWMGILVITASALLFVTTRGHVSAPIRITLGIIGIIVGYILMWPFVRTGAQDRHQK
jgi:uncharacterized membrane protein HdeD (DUF308 family)